MELGRGHGLADDGGAVAHERADGDSAHGVQLAVVRLFAPDALLCVGGVLEALGVCADAALLGRVHRVVRRPEAAALHKGLVHDQRVLLVVARVHHDGDDGVDAHAKVGDFAPRLCERLLRVVRHVHLRVQSAVVRHGGQRHCLLAHARLVDVARRLVPVGVRDLHGAVTQDARGVDLHVGVRLHLHFHFHFSLRRSTLVWVRDAQFVGRHGDAQLSLLVFINILNDAGVQETGPHFGSRG